MSLSGHEDAVTPIVGTVIVLAITVAGIATALYMGAPVLTNLRERAALENVIGQLEQVRAAANDMYVPDESRYPTVSIPAGQLALSEGSHVLITVDQDTVNLACDLRVSDWEAWTTSVSASTVGCRALQTNAATCAATSSTADVCFEVIRVDGSLETAAAWTAVTGAGTAVSPYVFTLPAIDPDSDYLFRLAQNVATPVVYAQAWLLHMDRLSWGVGGVNAAYEGGGVFAQEGEGFFLASSPLVSEDPLNGPYFLRFPTLQDSDHGAFSGSGSHSVGLVLRSGHLRVDWVEATLLRLDFHGDLAEPWCNAFLLRDVLASLDGDYYSEDAAEPTHACSGVSDPDGIRSLKYQERDAADVVVPFRFTLTQSIIHGSLLL